eukprot:scaffold128020_cov47-Attheya_sp.AAC.3
MKPNDDDDNGFQSTINIDSWQKKDSLMHAHFTLSVTCLDLALLSKRGLYAVRIAASEGGKYIFSCASQMGQASLSSECRCDETYVRA